MESFERKGIVVRLAMTRFTWSSRSAAAQQRLDPMPHPVLLLRKLKRDLDLAGLDSAVRWIERTSVQGWFRTASLPWWKRDYWVTGTEALYRGRDRHAPARRRGDAALCHRPTLHFRHPSPRPCVADGGKASRTAEPDSHGLSRARIASASASTSSRS